MAELFHNLKKRVSAFNMHVKAQPSPMDEEYMCKQRFILQVMLYCHKEMLFTKIAVNLHINSHDFRFIKLMD